MAKAGPFLFAAECDGNRTIIQNSKRRSDPLFTSIHIATVEDSLGQGQTEVQGALLSDLGRAGGILRAAVGGKP